LSPAVSPTSLLADLERRLRECGVKGKVVTGVVVVRRCDGGCGGGGQWW